MKVVEGLRLKFRSEGRLAIKAHRDWRAYALPMLLMPIGLVYWIAPNDLIPDRTPYFGRLDDVAAFAAAILACRLGVGYLWGDRPGSGLYRKLADKAATTRLHWIRERFTRRPDLRETCLALALFVFGRLLFRLTLGRWPTHDKLRLFRPAMARNFAPVPPLLRGLAVVQEGKELVVQLLQLSHIYGGNDSRSLIAPTFNLSIERLSLPPHVGNPLCVWAGPDIAFLHFEKAAGTSFLHEFTRMFHPCQIDSDPFRSMAPHLLSRFVSTSGVDAARYPLVWGHYDLPSIQRLGPNRIVYTILREPRARILSLYWYWRSVDPAVLRREGGNHTVREAHGLDLLGFLRSDDEMLRDYIDNVYARRLTGIYAAGAECDLLRADPSRGLDQALRALAQMPVVGITERLSESVACLGRYLGFTAPLNPPRANVTSDNAFSDPRFRVIEREPITAAIEAELVALTRLDCALYSAALERLSAAVPARDDVDATRRASAAEEPRSHLPGY